MSLLWGRYGYFLKLHIVLIILKFLILKFEILTQELGIKQKLACIVGIE